MMDSQYQLTELPLKNLIESIYLVVLSLSNNGQTFNSHMWLSLKPKRMIKLLFKWTCSLFF